MPEKECLKSENCVYFYLTTAIGDKIIASDAKIHGEFSIGGYKRVE